MAKKSRMQLIWGDILSEKTDVIVTPASRFPRTGTGLDRIIHAAAGKELDEARRQLGDIGPGIVKFSDSFGLRKTKCRAKKVVHALGPHVDGGDEGTNRALLIGCYLQIFCTAVALKAKTVSVPLMSTGKFGMPFELAIPAAIDAIQLFLSANDMLTIKLVCVDSEFLDYARQHYPSELIEKYSKDEELTYRKENPRKYIGGDDAVEETQPYFKQLKKKNELEKLGFCQLFSRVWKRTVAVNKKLKAEAIAKGRQAFALTSLICTRNDLSVASGVALRNIKHYLESSAGDRRPSRDVVIALAVAMKLDLDYTRALLRTCAYHFGDSERDCTIISHIQEGGGDVYGLQEKLEDKNLPTLKTYKD